MRNKIYYRHGTMFSGKSGNLISTIQTYWYNNRKTLVLKPAEDTRDKGVIKSRQSDVTIDCITFNKEQDLGVLFYKFKRQGHRFDIIFIDEVQFCTVKQIEQLHELSRYAPIMCYGLKTSYTGELFPAIASLLTIAEDISEIKTVCSMCKSKATHNLLLRDGTPVYSGDTFNVEGEKKEDVYKAVCREHFFSPILNNNLNELGEDN